MKLAEMTWPAVAALSLPATRARAGGAARPAWLDGGALEPLFLAGSNDDRLAGAGPLQDRDPPAELAEAEATGASLFVVSHDDPEEDKITRAMKKPGRLIPMKLSSPSILSASLCW